MKRFLILVLLLAAPWGARAAIPSHVHVIGGCQVQANQILVLLDQSGKAPTFDLYVICSAADWSYLMAKNDLPSATTALTDWKKNMIWFGPKALQGSAEMRQAVEHELEHLRCHCSMGESIPH